MKVLGWLKAVLAVALSLVIGFAIMGVVNLLVPTITIGWALTAVLTSSALSALAGFLAAGRGRKLPAPQQKEPTAK
jgi:hypothetical protein